MNNDSDDLKRQLELAENARSEAEARLAGRAEELELVKNELRSALEEVQSANRAKSLFLARMSHEVRTPMNAVIGMTRMALESGVSEEQQHFLTTVKNTSEALISLVNNVLDYSKIEVGELDMDAVDFDLRYLVESVMDRVVAREQGKGLERFCLVDADVPFRLAGDPTRLRQILINLLGNAVKFTEQGEVVLRVAVESEDETGSMLAFSVADSGAGIPPDHLDHIFDVFGPAESPDQQEFNRAGLGLSISRQLVKMMGGEMTVSSEVGQGSTFRFTARFERPSPETQRLPVAAPVAGTRVLVVGPMEIPRRAMAGILAAMGLLPLEAESGAEALMVLNRAAEGGEPFPLVLLDDQLSDMGVTGLIGRIRQDRQLREARIIILSSHGTRGEVNEYRQAGADGYLIKPVSRSQLFDAVSAVAALPAAGEGRVMVTRHSLEESKSRRAWVLLAGDDVEEQKQVVRVLRRHGMQVGIAGNGKAAVEAAASSAWDLLLIGFRLPVMGGPEAVRLIRERGKSSGRRLPIIALMAGPSAADMEACLSAGMDGYLTRPLDSGQLWNTVQRWLKPVPGTTADDPEEVSPEPLFDLEPVFRQHDRDLEFIRELAEIFLADTPSGLRDIRTALQRGDLERAEYIAHGLKGACANFGLVPLADIFSEIEDHGRNGQPEAALEAHARAARLYAAVDLALGKI